MDIWIIRDGEKAGPFPDYEIRRMIESGDIDGTTPAWHEKLDNWKPLADLGLFESALNPPPPEPAPVSPPPPPAPATPKSRPHLIRRFWARWLDLYLYSGLWWFLMWACHRDIGALLTDAWTVPLHYAPWFAVEAWMIHRFATTPGKWLLGIRVVHRDGSHLTLKASITRAMRILFMGIGFGIHLLCLLCQALAWITVKNIGTTLWDRAGGHRVEVKPLHPASVPAYTIALIFALWLKMIVLFPYIKEHMRDTQPKLYEQLEQNPTWHLPKR